MIPTEMVPLLVSWISCLYMPVVLGLYIRHRKSPYIRYRMPRRITAVATSIGACSLSLPILVYTDAHCHIYVAWLSIFVCAMVTYLVLQCSVVISFQITELLAKPRLATAASVHRTMRRRWLLHPKVQHVIYIVTNAIFLVPIYLPFKGRFANAFHLTRADCYDESSWNLLLGEVGAIAVVSGVLAVQVSRVVDNFGLRHAFLSTAKASLVGMLLQGAISLCSTYLHWKPWLDDNHVIDIVASLPFHGFFYFNVIHPLRSILLPSMFNQRVMVLSDPFSQHRAHSTSHFRAFLLHPDGFRAFLEFCRLELRVEMLLAWHVLTQFEAAPTARAAEHVFATCFAPHCIYATDVGEEFRVHFQLQQLGWSRLPPCAPVASNFFGAATAALLQRMYNVQFPRFLLHPDGVLAWHDFLDRKRAVEKLDQVLTIVSRQPSFNSSFPVKLHLPLNLNGGQHRGFG